MNDDLITNKEFVAYHKWLNDFKHINFAAYQAARSEIIAELAAARQEIERLKKELDDLIEVIATWGLGEAKLRWDLKMEREAHEQTKSELSYCRDMLAIIHRDGGHYLAEHGWKKAVEDVIARYYALITRAEKAEAELDRLRKRIEDAPTMTLEKCEDSYLYLQIPDSYHDWLELPKSMFQNIGPNQTTTIRLVVDERE